MLTFVLGDVPLAIHRALELLLTLCETCRLLRRASFVSMFLQVFWQACRTCATCCTCCDWSLATVCWLKELTAKEKGWKTYATSTGLLWFLIIEKTNASLCRVSFFLEHRSQRSLWVGDSNNACMKVWSMASQLRSFVRSIRSTIAAFVVKRQNHVHPYGWTSSFVRNLIFVRIPSLVSVCTSF